MPWIANATGKSRWSGNTIPPREPTDWVSIVVGGVGGCLLYLGMIFGGITAYVFIIMRIPVRDASESGLFARAMQSTSLGILVLVALAAVAVFAVGFLFAAGWRLANRNRAK